MVKKLGAHICLNNPHLNGHASGVARTYPMDYNLEMKHNPARVTNHKSHSCPNIYNNPDPKLKHGIHPAPKTKGDYSLFSFEMNAQQK